ncbi:DUF4132 domain-containing protein [Glycomyces tenuis]|uniref:DUF4132 domain-containing protein n=1 Tax=Glycomyces tenuis TaxID=58116 RepID=UPI0003FEAA73|nr:DUF4132 domain-containing protein [Glycomyces tenuis]
MNESPATLPDENRLELPAAWARQLLPLRGERPGRGVELDAQAPETVRDLILRHREELLQALAAPENRDYADAAEAYIEGEPDARGAGAVTALLLYSSHRPVRSPLRPELDAWVLDHGLPFAVCAVIETLATSAWRPGGGVRNPGIAVRILEPAVVGDLYSLVRDPEDSVEVLRSLLADAADEEYAAVVAAVAAHRDSPVKRVAAMFLLPGERGWSDEACLDYAAGRTYGHTDRIVFHSARSIAQVTAAGISSIKDYYITSASVAALSDGLGTESLPILTESLGRPLNVGDRRLLLGAVAMLPSDQATAYLLDRLDEPHVFEFAVAAAERFPVRTLRAIAALAAGADGRRRLRLAGVAAAHPALMEAARASLTGSERAVLDELAADGSSVPTAAPETLPPLLTAPPWTKRRARSKPAVVPGLQPIGEPRLVWADGEREHWAELPHPYRPGTDERYLRRLLDNLDGPRPNRRIAEILAYAPLETAAPLLERWEGGPGRYWETTYQRLLARFGEAVVEGIVADLAKEPRSQAVLLPVLSLEVARITADRFQRLKSARAEARDWLDRHGAAAARLLVPDALGTGKQARAAAEAALSYVAMRHGPEAVRAAAEPYGPAAAEGIERLLDTDPLEPVGVKLPHPGPWANPAMLPQVLLKGRETALPDASVPHLVTVLAVGTPDYEYAGVDVVAESCDGDSLREFSWALFELWISVGAPSKDGWALTQLAHFADDETVRRLTPLIREWPGQSQHKRAVTGLEVLGAIGSEEALRAIHGISQKVKFKALKEKATEQIEAIAAGLGLSGEQLGDRLVPDFGLDDETSLVLDYGPRTFKVGFDEQLKPFVTDADGKPRKSLPKPGAKDDAAVAEAAYKRFAQLKKDLRTVAADQVRRLEHALVAGRTWTTGEFREYFVDHPLVWHLARRLVWLAESGGESSVFRLAEDKTFTDVEENELDLPADALVRLAHPAHLDRETIDAWAEILADYEILQPFPQLSRPVMAFTDEELRTGRLERFEGAKVDVGKILGLVKRGWQRAAPEDAGVEPGISYALPGGGFVVVALNPGIAVGYIEEWPSQTLEAVRLSAVDDYWHRRDRGPDHPTEIDAVTASEVLAALARITETA